MTFGVIELVIGGIILLAWCYFKYLRYDYWIKLGIRGPKPVPLLGNFYKAALGRMSVIENVDEVYNDWKHEPYYGAYLGTNPVLMINSPELAKIILVKEFNTFPGRGMHVSENDDSLASNIFALDGHRWKVLRSHFTPIFTTGKLKRMVDLILESTDNFENYLNDEVKKNNIIDIREAAAKFTTDVIGSCAFGINTNSISNTESEFRKMGKKIFATDGISHFRRILRDFAPSLARILLKILRPKFMNFFTDLVRDTIEYREKNNLNRGDLVDVLKAMKEKKDDMDIKLTDNILAAQAVIFFAAGFETSSTTISFSCYELALAPDCQDKLRDEIKKTLDKHEGKLSYEIINEMKYLDMVMKETLRKNPPAGSLIRESVTPWTIPGTNTTLPANTKVFFPTFSYHRNSEYFPDPEVFDPLRFSDERKSEIIQGTYSPFGDGPKNCIGERFAIYQTKLGIISILKNFIIKPSEHTKKNYPIDKASLVLAIQGGVPLKLIPCKC